MVQIRTTAPPNQTTNGRDDYAVRATNRSQDTVPTESEIRTRAFELYKARGTKPGSAAADWQQAERELRERRARTP